MYAKKTKNIQLCYFSLVALGNLIHYPYTMIQRFPRATSEKWRVTKKVKDNGSEKVNF